MGIWRNSGVAIDSGVAVFERVVKKLPQLQAIIGVGASQKRKQAMEFRGVPMRSFVMEREKDSGCVQPECTIKRVTQCANDGQGGICEKFHKRLIAASFLSGPVAFQHLSKVISKPFRLTIPGAGSQIPRGFLGRNGFRLRCATPGQVDSSSTAHRADEAPCSGPAPYF